MLWPAGRGFGGKLSLPDGRDGMEGTAAEVGRPAGRGFGGKLSLLAGRDEMEGGVAEGGVSQLFSVKYTAANTRNLNSSTENDLKWTKAQILAPRP